MPDPDPTDRPPDPRRLRTEGRLVTAEGDLAAKAVEIEELEADLAAEIAEITQRWEAAAREVELVKVPLEKSDVEVEPLVLVWIPVSG